MGHLYAFWLAVSGQIVMIRSRSNIVIAGGTGSGKTVLMLKIFENAERLFDEPPSQWLWFKGHEGTDTPRGIKTFNGIPDAELLEHLTKGVKGTAVVIDDGLVELTKNPDFLTKLVTVYTHHMNLTVFFLVQSLFYFPRIARINTQYYLLLKNPGDKLGTSTLFRHCAGARAAAYNEVFEQVTKDPFSYLLLDLHPQTNENHRLLSHIFNRYPFVYVPKK